MLPVSMAWPQNTPVHSAEVMGKLLCCSLMKPLLLMQFRDEAEAAGKLLPARHPVSRAVREVGLRIAAVAQEDVDGRPIQHMKVQHLCRFLHLICRTSQEQEFQVSQVILHLQSNICMACPYRCAILGEVGSYWLRVGHKVLFICAGSGVGVCGHQRAW